MIWQSTSEFWSMGGYGAYVWGSLGVSAALLALEVWLVRMGRQLALDAVFEAMDAEPDRSEQYPSSHPTGHSPRKTTGASS